MPEVDGSFFDRADAHIDLCNSQMDDGTAAGIVSASMMYANARFSAWVAATSFKTADDMDRHRSEKIAYFVEQFRLMLEENYSDYAAHFERYLRPEDGA